jgi:hypothetical protein
MITNVSFLMKGMASALIATSVLRPLLVAHTATLMVSPR